MGFVITLLVLVGAALIYGWVKLINAIFNPIINRLENKKRRLNKADNPYIQMHRLKFENDAMYEEYIEWLDKNGGDIPFEKWKTSLDRKADRDINKHLKM